MDSGVNIHPDRGQVLEWTLGHSIDSERLRARSRQTRKRFRTSTTRNGARQIAGQRFPLRLVPSQFDVIGNFDHILKWPSAPFWLQLPATRTVTNRALASVSSVDEYGDLPRHEQAHIADHHEGAIV